ncbi:MAG: phosphotransferase [Caldilineae bacterium]|nr:MAG: phosphotransferase [Caldilineae bacterium]
MQHLPFDKPGRFWRGNLHTHSTLSDGMLTPEQVCARYRDAGYDFLALTDHFLAHYDFPLADTRPFRSNGFTTILGAELHSGRINNGERWHILAVGLPLDFPPPPEDETGPQIAARALAAGAFVAVAHPNWYTLDEADVTALGQVHAVEIFNGVAVDANDKADSWHMLDIMLDRGKRYFAYAADDAHFTEKYNDFQRGWVQVKCERLEPESLLAALKAGHFYSSTGPEIYDIQVTPGAQLSVRCSPAERIFLTGRGSQARRVWGNGVTEAVFDLSDWTSPHCRVTVRDRNGRAWSNPIWLTG